MFDGSHTHTYSGAHTYTGLHISDLSMPTVIRIQVCVSLTLGPKIRLACKHIAASEDQASESKQHGASMFEDKSSRSKKLSELRKLALNI